MLGANIIVVPILVATAYLATRKKELGGEHGDHERHLREHFVPVDPGAVTMQALPYLGILALVALLTLPAPWRGLQPIDGWILFLAYLAFLAQALSRGRENGEEIAWERPRTVAGGRRRGRARGRGLFHHLLDRADRERPRYPEDHGSAVHHRADGGAAGGLRHMDPCPKSPDHGGGNRCDRRYGGNNDHSLHPAHGHRDADREPHLYWVSLAFVAIVPALYAALLSWGGRTTGFRCAVLAARLVAAAGSGGPRGLDWPSGLHRPHGGDRAGRSTGPVRASRPARPWRSLLRLLPRRGGLMADGSERRLDEVPPERRW